MLSLGQVYKKVNMVMSRLLLVGYIFSRVCYLPKGRFVLLRVAFKPLTREHARLTKWPYIIRSMSVVGISRSVVTACCCLLVCVCV